MKYLLILLSLLTFLPLTKGQTIQDLEKELNVDPDSINRIILNSRRLILENAQKGNFEKVREIRDYYESKFDRKLYQLFSNRNEIFLQYLLSDFDRIIKTFNNPPSELDIRFRYYSYSYLYEVNDPEISTFSLQQEGALRDVLLKEKSRVEQDILQLVQLSPVQKDVLILYLSLALEDKPTTKEPANEFLQKHPNSAFDLFVKQSIRRRFIKDQSGFSGGMVLGGGVSNFSGGMDDVVRLDGNSILNFEIFYNRWMAAFGMLASYGEVQQGFTDKGRLWPQNLEIQATYYGLNVGYAFLDASRVRFAPILHIGGMGMSPSTTEQEDDKRYEDYNLDAFVYGYGVLLDIYPCIWIGRYDDQLYRLGIRTQLGQFHHNYENSDSRFGGSLDYLSIGVIWDISKTKLDLR
jgi:hypothetical protein